MRNSIHTLFLVGVLLLVSSCIGSWPAIPLSSEASVTVKATRLDKNGKELERIEVHSKHRDWRLIVSPEGPARYTKYAAPRLYLVDKGGKHLLKFMMLKSQSTLRSCTFFALKDVPLWAGIGYPQSCDDKKFADAEVFIFNRKGIHRVITVSDCIVELDNSGMYRRKWKHEGNMLFFETRDGIIRFSLQTGTLQK